MSSLLIAVKSCFRDLEAGAHDVIRATWGQAFQGKAYVKFFIGRPVTSIDRSLPSSDRNSYIAKSDEVILNCSDDYESLVYKTREICKYAANRAIDHILLVDTDCCVFPDKVFSSGYQLADYAGRFNGTWGGCGRRIVRGQNDTQVAMDKCYSWTSGAGYFLSRRAASEIAETTPQLYQYVYGGNEDLWVGQVLGPLCAEGKLISMQLDEPVCKYYLTPEGHSKGYDPKSGWMESVWKSRTS